MEPPYLMNWVLQWTDRFKTIPMIERYSEKRSKPHSENLPAPAGGGQVRSGS